MQPGGGAPPLGCMNFPNLKVSSFMTMFELAISDAKVCSGEVCKFMVACTRSWDFVKTGLAVFQKQKAGPDTVSRS